MSDAAPTSRETRGLDHDGSSRGQLGARAKDGVEAVGRRRDKHGRGRAPSALGVGAETGIVRRQCAVSMGIGRGCGPWREHHKLAVVDSPAAWFLVVRFQNLPAEPIRPGWSAAWWRMESAAPDEDRAGGARPRPASRSLRRCGVGRAGDREGIVKEEEEEGEEEGAESSGRERWQRLEVKEEEEEEEERQKMIRNRMETPRHAFPTGHCPLGSLRTERTQEYLPKVPA
ncbi:hypothetical protein CDD83_10573 [Cordyceps sp. RAO-2017]|nr:hypothetical protein CDD83_10573 [Cordyceps sp. RAO-2017]